jgi:hypothetical protein
LTLHSDDIIAGFAMGQTIGYHLVKSGFGLWLPGDERGHWSEAWDEQLGYIEPHTLHSGDPVRKRMAEERMKHPPVRFTREMMDVIMAMAGECAAKSEWKIAAAAIECTHMHLLITYSGIDINKTAKWLAQEMTKAMHRQTSHAGPVWCEGRWRGFIFDILHWNSTIKYIGQDNERRGLPTKPYDFIM